MRMHSNPPQSPSSSLYVVVAHLYPLDEAPLALGHKLVSALSALALVLEHAGEHEEEAGDGGGRQLLPHYVKLLHDEDPLNSAILSNKTEYLRLIL